MCSFNSHKNRHIHHWVVMDEQTNEQTRVADEQEPGALFDDY